MYLTFEEYKTLGGTLDEAAFMLYEFEAEKEIDAQTFGRITEPSITVKQCMVRLTDIYAKADISKNQVASFSNDGVNQSFKNVSAADYSKQADDIVFKYLMNEVDENGTPLLYRGVSL